MPYPKIELTPALMDACLAAKSCSADIDSIKLIKKRLPLGDLESIESKYALLDACGIQSENTCSQQVLDGMMYQLAPEEAKQTNESYKLRVQEMVRQQWHQSCVELSLEPAVELVAILLRSKIKPHYHQLLNEIEKLKPFHLLREVNFDALERRAYHTYVQGGVDETRMFNKAKNYFKAFNKHQNYLRQSLTVRHTMLNIEIARSIEERLVESGVQAFLSVECLISLARLEPDPLLSIELGPQEYLQLSGELEHHSVESMDLDSLEVDLDPLLSLIPK